MPKFGKKGSARCAPRPARQVRSGQATQLFEGIDRTDDLVELSGQLRRLAVALMKIANDLRWMNSGRWRG